jgi:hypothetical protein
MNDMFSITPSTELMAVVMVIPASLTWISRSSSLARQSPSWSWTRHRLLNSWSSAHDVSSKARRAATTARSTSDSSASHACPSTDPSVGLTLS